MKRKFWNEQRKIGFVILLIIGVAVNGAYIGSLGREHFTKYGIPTGEITIKSCLIAFFETFIILGFMLWMIGLPELTPNTKAEYDKRKMGKGG